MAFDTAALSDAAFADVTFPGGQFAPQPPRSNRVSAVYEEAVTSGAATLNRVSTVYKEAVTSGAATYNRVSAVYAEVVAVAPPGADQLSTQYAEVITSGATPPAQLSTQYAEVITSGANPQNQVSTQYVEIIASAQGTPFQLQQETFRFRTDSGPVDGTPTWGAAESVPYNPGALPFRLRVSLDNVAGDGSPPAPFPYQIWVSRNGGPYHPVTGVSPDCCVGTGGNTEPTGTPVLIPRLTRPV